MTGNATGRNFDFFRRTGSPHGPQRSSLVPADDPTPLFYQRRANQFKDIFLDWKAAITPRHELQKRVRAGGKHNDLEKTSAKAGSAVITPFFRDARQFSFGDYFASARLLPMPGARHEPGVVRHAEADWLCITIFLRRRRCGRISGR